MALSTNAFVQIAYEEGEYTDDRGNFWTRGMDGWFCDLGDGKMLARHHEFVEMVEMENPEAG